MLRQQLNTLIATIPSNMCWLNGYDAWSLYTHQCLVVNTIGNHTTSAPLVGTADEAAACRSTSDGRLLAAY